MALPSLRNKGGEITMPTAISKMAEKLEFAKYYIDNSLLPNNIKDPYQAVAIIERGNILIIDNNSAQIEMIEKIGNSAKIGLFLYEK